MMKKIKFKGLRLTSPRKDRNGANDESDPQLPHSPVSIDSPDDSYCMPDENPVSPVDSGSKRKGTKNIFATIRKKFTSQRRKGEDERKSHAWYGYDDGPGVSGWATMAASWRTARRSVQKPIRPAHSEERLSASGLDRSPHIPRPRRDHARAVSADRNRIRERSCNGFCGKKELSSTSKSEDESEKEDSFHDDEERAAKEILPLDFEYGHASAPLNNDMNGGISPSRNGHCEFGHHQDSDKSDKDESNGSDHKSSSSQQEIYEPTDEQSHASQPLQQQTVPPFYDQVREETSKTWNLTHELFRLTKYGWYWGPITRTEAEEKLTNQPDGAFLVRDSSDERYLLSLSFRSYGRTLHTRIEHCNGVFSFYAQPESEGYSSVVDLIEHSMTDSQTGVFCYSRARTPGSPSFPVRLTKPVSRFTQVRSLQYLCRFVIRQYTRYDHIQKLPLPSSIKGWLEENQY